MDGLSTNPEPPPLIEAFMAFRPGHHRLGELLVKQGLCTLDDIASGLRQGPCEDERLGEILIRLGVCTRQQVAETLRMQEVAADPIWECLGRLAWHPETRITRGGHEIVAGVPRLGTYLRFGLEEMQIAELIAAERSYQGILRGAWGRAQIVVTPEQVVMLGRQLRAAGLIYDPTKGLDSIGVPALSPTPWQIRFSLADPSGLLDSLLPILKATSSLPFLFVAWLPLVLLAAGSAILHPAEIANALQASTHMSGWTLLLAGYVSIALVVLVHELGHAAVAHALGAPVHELGIMLYMGIPLGYVNVSAAHLLARKRDRLAVSLGGLYYQLGFSALAMLAWAWLPLGAEGKAIALNLGLISGGSILFDLNPFAKMDGYYVLSDLLGIRNLRDRSFTFLFKRLKGEPSEVLDHAQKRILLSYAVVATLMTFILLGVGMAGWFWLLQRLFMRGSA